MQKTLKWTPAQPAKRPDNIISSKARGTGDVGFQPSYLAEKQENMRFIMSNEYMRMWFKERGRYEKNTYSKEQIIKEESKIRRRFVQRMMTYKKPDKNEFFEEIVKTKKAPKNGESMDQPADYRKYKYKPVCLKHNKVSVSKTDENILSNDKNFKNPLKNCPKKEAHNDTLDNAGDKSPPVILIPANQLCQVPHCPCP